MWKKPGLASISSWSISTMVPTGNMPLISLRKLLLVKLMDSVVSAISLVFMALPFGVVLSFYLLLYTVWRVGANLFRYFLLSIFRVRQTKVSGVAIIATTTMFASNGGRHEA